MQYNSDTCVNTKRGDRRMSAPTAGGTDSGEAALGINTKSASPQTPCKVPPAQRTRGLRDTRYALQTSIRRLVIAKSDFDPENPDLDVYNKLPRVTKCKWVRVKPTVDIKHAMAENKAHYCNLTTCGSVWTCPVCAHRVQEIRRQEIHRGVEWAKSVGLQPVMLTLTTPHYSHQSCADLLTRLSAAHKYLVSGKAWVNFKNSVGYQGMIRSLETLYGKSGWHSHFHVLWFVDASADLDSIADFVLTRWEKACQKQKLIPKGKLRAFRSHSVKVSLAHNSGEYLAKQDDEKYMVRWGADREIAKGNSKTYREKSGLLHPFELAGFWAEHGDPKAADLFMEYLEAFKGKAQIFWTQGLKIRAGINEVSDKEAAEAEYEDSVKVMSLESFAWDLVRSKGMRSKVLTMIESGGVEDVENWLRFHGMNSVLSHEMPLINSLRK